VLCWHLNNLYELYGEYSGVRIARKHIAWYCKGKAHAADFRQRVYRVESAREQLDLVESFFLSGQYEDAAPRNGYPAPVLSASGPTSQWSDTLEMIS